MDFVLLLILGLLVIAFYFLHGASEYARGRRDSYEDIIEHIKQDPVSRKLWEEMERNERLRSSDS